MTTACACCCEQDVGLSPGLMAVVQDPFTAGREIFIELKMQGLNHGPEDTVTHPYEDLLCMKCWEKLFARLKEALPEEDPDFPKEPPPVISGPPLAPEIVMEGAKPSKALKPMKLARKFLELPWVLRMTIAEGLGIREPNDSELREHDMELAIFKRAKEQDKLTEFGQAIQAAHEDMRKRSQQKETT